MTTAAPADPGFPELPACLPGMRIGLFGGSFNPIHEGHRLVALQCLKRLQLDRLWLLVSPGNPLKDHGDLAPLAARMAAARAMMDHPQIEVTDYEARQGFSYTFDTLSHLVRRCEGARFVWIMGADSLGGFHRWERWEDIARLVPMAVYARPGSNLRATFSRAATALGAYRIPEDQAETLAGRAPPAWVYLHGIMSAQSSTAIRKKRRVGAN